MAKNYKPVEYASTTFESRIYHKKQKFSKSTEGVSSIHYRSESLNQNDSPGKLSYSISGSHYNFLKNMLFDSASFYGYNYIYKNKFPSSGSVIYIPQQYYGEQIKPNSFTLTEGNIKIKDDGQGNLYPTNAVNSRSNASANSSSENYVGNIQYQMGVVTITETGSWSGSGASSTDIMYTDIGKTDFKIKFDATQTIHQNQIVCKVNKNEFTATSNPSLWSGSHYLASNISSSLSNWSPYATGIAFYDKTPDIYSRLENRNFIFEIKPGLNTIVWPDNPVMLDEMIPNQINTIDNELQQEAYRNQLGVWEGSFNQLLPGVTYYISSNASSTFNWELRSNQIQQRGVPLLVGKFPKPVKIDKESDLTIIIRYDV